MRKICPMGVWCAWGVVCLVCSEMKEMMSIAPTCCTALSNLLHGTCLRPEPGYPKEKLCRWA